MENREELSDNSNKNKGVQWVMYLIILLPAFIGLTIFVGPMIGIIGCLILGIVIKLKSNKSTSSKENP